MSLDLGKSSHCCVGCTSKLSSKCNLVATVDDMRKRTPGGNKFKKKRYMKKMVKHLSGWHRLDDELLVTTVITRDSIFSQSITFNGDASWPLSSSKWSSFTVETDSVHPKLCRILL